MHADTSEKTDSKLVPSLHQVRAVNSAHPAGQPLRLLHCTQGSGQPASSPSVLY